MCVNSDIRIRLYTGNVKYTQYSYATHLLPVDILDNLPLRVYLWYIDYIIIVFIIVFINDASWYTVYDFKYFQGLPFGLFQFEDL